jgi:hypothetical protein
MELTQSNVLLSVRSHPVERAIVALVVCPLLTLLSCYVLIATVATGINIPVAAIALIILGIAVASPIVEHRYRLTITDTYVEQQYWKKTRLAYTEIEEVIVWPRTITLCGERKRIQLPGTIEKRRLVLETIVTQLKPLSGITYSGSREHIVKLFGVEQR